MNTLSQQQICTETVVHEARGYHLLLRLSGCKSAQLNDEQSLRILAEKAATATGASVLEVSSRRFEPQGITVLIMLAESHASLHTYPESGVVFWDCFTCGSTCSPELSTTILEESLKPSSVSSQLIERD